MITYFYPNTMKNITVAMLDLFNDVPIRKLDINGNTVKEWYVPIMFGGVDKVFKDRTENHYFETLDLSGTIYTPFEDTSTSAITDEYYKTTFIEKGKRYYETVPRMSMVMTGITYDASRAYGVNEWRSWISENTGIPEQAFEDYQPTPYNIDFTLFIRADSMDYFSQIMENILPYFNPKLFLRVKEFSFLNLERNLPVSLVSISPEIVDELNNDAVRQINAQLNFQVEAFLYRPVTDAKMIKYIKSNYRFLDHNQGVVEGFSTSAYESSGGTPLIISATPMTSAYDSSGVGNNGSEFVYYIKNMGM